MAGIAQAQKVPPAEKLSEETQKAQPVKKLPEDTQKVPPAEKLSEEAQKTPPAEKLSEDTQKTPPAEKLSEEAQKVPPAEKQSTENPSEVVEKIPAAEKLFPQSTQGFISIANVENLIRHFDNTQLGKLAADPVMKPFAEDVKRQFESRWSNVHDRLGVTLEDLRDVPSGEVSIGLIEPAKKQSAIAITVDITGRGEQAREMLEKINRNLTVQGAKRTELKAPNYAEPIIQFLLPVPEEEREAEGTQLARSRARRPSIRCRRLPPPPRRDMLFIS